MMPPLLLLLCPCPGQPKASTPRCAPIVSLLPAHRRLHPFPFNRKASVRRVPGASTSTHGGPTSSSSIMDENKPPHRMKGVTVCLPIAYGSIAWNMTKKSEQEQCTHQWSCTCLRWGGWVFHRIIIILFHSIPSNQCTCGARTATTSGRCSRRPSLRCTRVSSTTSEVRLLLWVSSLSVARPQASHPTNFLSSHDVDVATHPFEVTEKGWGEFEALVDLHFKDAHEKPVELRHQVKLFHGKDGPTTQSSNKKVCRYCWGWGLMDGQNERPLLTISTKRQPVVHEYYDEVVFTDPTEEFYQCLQHLGETKTHRHTLQDLFPLYSDVEDIRRIQAAHEFITDQLRSTYSLFFRTHHDPSRSRSPHATKTQRPRTSCCGWRARPRPRSKRRRRPPPLPWLPQHPPHQRP